MPLDSAGYSRIEDIPPEYLDAARKQAFLQREQESGKQYQAYNHPYTWIILDFDVPDIADQRLVLERLPDVSCSCCHEQHCTCGARRCSTCQQCTVHCTC